MLKRALLAALLLGSGVLFSTNAYADGYRVTLNAVKVLRNGQLVAPPIGCEFTYTTQEITQLGSLTRAPTSNDFICGQAPSQPAGSGNGTGGSGSTSGSTTTTTTASWRGPFAANTSYLAGDLISYNGAFYTAKVAFTSASAFSAADWTALAVSSTPTQTTSYRGPWAANTSYLAGDLVLQNSILYSANASFTSSTSFVAGNWTAVSSTSSGGTTAETISTVYTAAGPIAVTDRKSLVIIPANSNFAMTLANGTTDGQKITVKRYGPGTMSLTLKLDGVSNQAITFLKPTAPYESVTVSWDATRTTWQLN